MKPIRDYLIDSSPLINGWNKIYSTSRLSKLAVNQQKHTLWLVDFLSTENIARFDPYSQITKLIHSPDDRAYSITHVCYTDRLWLIATVPPLLLSIEPISETITRHMETGQWYLAAHCQETYNHQTLFIDRKMLMVHDGTTFSENYWNSEQYLSSFVQSPLGKIWVATEEGEVYTSDQLGEKWQLLGKTDQPIKFLKFIDSEIWLTDKDQKAIYRWNPDLPLPGKPLTESNQPSYGVIHLVEKIGTNMVWIITETAIWQYQDNKLSQVLIPLYTESIISAVFDNGLNRMYIATDRGIYYKDLGQP